MWTSLEEHHFICHKDYEDTCLGARENEVPNNSQIHCFAADDMLTEEGRESYPVGLYKVQGLAAVCLSAALYGSAFFPLAPRCTLAQK